MDNVVVIPKNGVEYVFSVRDGINDDLSRLSDSIVSNRSMGLRDVALTMVASISAAYLGVHAFRFFGFRTDLGSAAGAVLGGLVLDVVGKSIQQGRIK